MVNQYKIINASAKVASIGLMLLHTDEKTSCTELKKVKMITKWKAKKAGSTTYPSAEIAARAK